MFPVLYYAENYKKDLTISNQLILKITFLSNERTSFNVELFRALTSRNIRSWVIQNLSYTIATNVTYRRLFINYLINYSLRHFQKPVH